MAEMNTNPDIIETEQSVTLSIPRRNLAIEAAGEIEQLCIILKQTMKEDADYLGISGVVSRIKFLSNKVMDVVCDEIKSTGEIAEELAE